MIRLIGAETHRWVARRGLWVALLGLLAILATMCWSIVVATRPPEAAVVAQGKIAYAEQHAYWVENHEQEEAFCRASDPEAPADPYRRLRNALIVQVRGEIGILRDG